MPGIHVMLWLTGCGHDSTGHGTRELLPKDTRLLDFYLPAIPRKPFETAYGALSPGFPAGRGQAVLPGLSVPSRIFVFDSSYRKHVAAVSFSPFPLSSTTSSHPPLAPKESRQRPVWWTVGKADISRAPGDGLGCIWSGGILGRQGCPSMAVAES